MTNSMNEYLLGAFALVAVAMIIFSVAPASAITSGGADLRLQLAKYDPAPAEKDQLLSIWIQVTNVGAEKAENSVFTLEPTYPFTMVGNPVVNYGNINAGDDIQLEYKLLVDSNAPKGVSPIKLKYTYGSGSTVYETTFNITVQESPTNADLKVLFVEMVPTAYPTASTKMTVDIVNTAPGDANYIIATAQSDIAVIDRNEIFVGTLKADDFDSVDFDMVIKPDTAPGMYPINFTLTYKDENFDPHVVQDTMYINVVSLKEGLAEQSTTSPVMIIIYIIIIFVIIRAVGVKFVKWFFRPVVKRWQKPKAAMV